MSEVKQADGRRLGAIMFTDVVGYSSISENDEKTALRILEEHRKLLTAIFPKHEGVIVKTIGDAFLVEFASAVEAVDCALEAQSEMRKFNEGRGQNERVTIRVAIHVGDIVHSGGDILGDAVNVAARVEQFAEPGGICVTQQVVDQVRGKVQCQLVSLGTRELKNIKNPVELYRVVPSQTSNFEKEVLDSRRIAVLPLANMSPDPNDRYFADGMTEELISTISKIGELRVISRTSIMRYRDSALSLGQIAQELGAGSILEGSVRKAGNRVRITAQLIQADRDQHVWSQSYDRDLVDVFAIQGDIAEQVAEALKVQLLSKEKKSIEKKPTTSPEAYTLYLKGRHYWNERTETGVNKAIKYFEEAVKTDPDFALAYSGLADAYLIMSDYSWMDPAEAGLLAKRNVTRALEIDDSLAEAHASHGLLLSQAWDLSWAERELKRSIELKPNYVAAYQWYAINQAFLGRYEEADEFFARASSLDPFSRVLGMNRGVILFYLRKYDEANEQLDKVIEANPDFAAPHFWKSLVCVQLRKFENAMEEAKKAVELDNGSANMKLWLASIYAQMGEKQSATRVMNEALSEKRGYSSPAAVALIKFRLGDKEEAFSLFEKALETRDTSLLYLRGSPGFEECQSDPRWAEIEKKIKLLTS
ncbi:MAG: tetratricopeptide repeat protein [Thaumarchaeota archaeon]|nr:tetratricopeptide repeat protein [Nitrososphaerota archaeon]